MGHLERSTAFGRQSCPIVGHAGSAEVGAPVDVMYASLGVLVHVQTFVTWVSVGCDQQFELL